MLVYSLLPCRTRILYIEQTMHCILRLCVMCTFRFAPICAKSRPKFLDPLPFLQLRACRVMMTQSIAEH